METTRLDELTARQFNTDLATAAALIMEGRVWIGAVPADKAGTAVPVDTTLTLREKPRKFASRSGYKLEKALSAFSVDPAGATVCDIGASNGGFTDCLLQNGAAYMIGLPRTEIVPCHFSSEANQVGALYACLHTVGRTD